MLDWKKYNEDSPPELNKECIIISNEYNSTRLCIAELERWTNGKLYWMENMDGTSVTSVTHYAEINLPEEYKAPTD